MVNTRIRCLKTLKKKNLSIHDIRKEIVVENNRFLFLVVSVRIKTKTKIYTHVQRAVVT